MHFPLLSGIARGLGKPWPSFGPSLREYKERYHCGQTIQEKQSCFCPTPALTSGPCTKHLKQEKALSYHTAHLLISHLHIPEQQQSLAGWALHIPLSQQAGAHHSFRLNQAINLQGHLCITWMLPGTSLWLGQSTRCSRGSTENPGRHLG